LNPDSGEAQGLVHDAWLQVRQSYGNKVSKPLLFRCIRNRHIDQYRRNQNIEFTPVDDFGRDAGDQTGAFDVVELPDGRLQYALTQLREAEREALFLSVVEGYTAKEISDLTLTARGTVLSLIHRARHKLKEILTDDKVTPINRKAVENLT